MSATPCPHRHTASRGRLPLVRVVPHRAEPGTDDEPSPPRPQWADRLSAREAEVLLCLARGLSNSEVAAELFVSLTTVKTHVASLLAKLQARDRVQLVIAAYRSGFVPD